MNILVFSWRDPKHPLAGGAEQVMHEHMKGWINAGHKVTLFASKMPDLPKTENLDGVKIVRSGFQYWGVQFSALFYYTKNKSKYDFLVDQFHGIPFFTPLYSKKPKLAVIQEAARKVWLLNPLPKPINWIVGFIGYFGEPFLFLFYRRTPFMTGSESAKKDLLRNGIPEKNITVVEHGTLIIDPGKKVTKAKKQTVVYLGRLSKDKGIEDALKCFAIIKKEKNVNFWVIGKPETEEYGQLVKKLTKELGLEEDIVFWNEKEGYLSDKRKFELLKEAHIMVNPSALEGWGLVNIEANAMGTPVVAYPSQGLVDSVKDGVSGILVRKKTPESLAAGVMSLLNDKNKLMELSRRAVGWSKNFTWQKARNKSLKLISSLQ